MKLSLEGYDVVNFYLKHKTETFIQDGVSFYGKKRGGYFRNYLNIYEIVKQTQPDIIVSNFSYVNPALLFGSILGVKKNIVWFHTVYGHSRPNKLKIIIKKRFLKLADLVIANSEILQKEMQEVYNMPSHKTCSIAFWTNISNHQSNSDLLYRERKENVLYIGCPGRLVADKNHALVIKAIAALKQTTNKTLRLYIAGNGVFKNELQQLVKDLHLEENVVFLGLLDVSEMIAFYKAMDVVVLPSFHEAFGLVFIEAIALGTPVLVSNAFGALDFIDRNRFPLQHISFNPESVQDLCEKLDPYVTGNGLGSSYFKTMYEATFEKDVIYNQVKTAILNKNMST